jgi:hypothetical protein
VQALCCRIKAILRYGSRPAYCCTCLATKLTVSLNEVRDATKVLVRRPDIRLYLGGCHSCYGWERVIRAVTIG